MTNPKTARPAAHPNVVLGMLLAAYIFNYLDRQILSILAVPIQRDLQLSDARMGMLGGIAFALLYSTLAVPLGALADRRGRSTVIVAALTVWSACTALCGFAQGFGQMFIARLGVGVGEAGGVAPSYALISGYFPSGRRARALAVYALGVPLGAATGVLAGGAIAAAVNWRTAFIVVGLTGLVFAIPFRLLVRDPPPPAVATAAPRIGAVARKLAAKPSFWLLAFGSAAGSTMGYGLGFWMPSFVQRTYGIGLVPTSHFIAGLLLIGGVPGVLFGGRIADRLGVRDRAWYSWVPGIAYLCSVPLYAGGFATDNVTVSFALLLIPSALAYMWIGPVTSAVQHLVEPQERATASALFLLINNLIGLGGGIYLLGALSTALTPHFGAASLRYAMLGGLAFYVLAAGLMAAAGRTIRRDWVDEA